MWHCVCLDVACCVSNGSLGVLVLTLIKMVCYFIVKTIPYFGYKLENALARFLPQIYVYLVWSFEINICFFTKDLS